MKRWLFLLVLCLTLLTGCDSWELKRVVPETASTVKREAISNPNGFNEEFVQGASDYTRYARDEWQAAARYLYDNVGLQLYYVELGITDYNGVETQEHANNRVKEFVEEEILAVDPYAVVLATTFVDKLPNGIEIGAAAHGEYWYYGEEASNWFDANARVIWKECFDMRWRVDFDLDNNYIWVKGAVDTLMDIDSKEVVINGSWIVPVAAIIAIAGVVALVVILIHRAKKRQDDLAILNADLDKSKIDDDLLDKYE